MTLTVELNQLEIQVEIIRKQNKNVYMRFKDSKHLIVTCNRLVSERKISKIIERNKKALEKMQSMKESEEKKDIFFQYLGKSYTRIFDGETKEVTFLSDNVIAKDKKTLDNLKNTIYISH